MIAAVPDLPESLLRILPRGSAVGAGERLLLGGCDAVELAGEFGTPAYVVVEDDLRARARDFLRALRAAHPNSQVVFASKAFPCTPVLRVLAEEGLACDVASGGELALALAAGFAAAQIVLHGNARSPRELAEAVEAGVGLVVLDGFDDIGRLAVAVREGGAERPQPVLIRVTPDVAGETHRAISTGQADSKFGFSMNEAPRAVEEVARRPELELQGLHCHVGSQLMTLEPFCAAATALGRLGRWPTVDLGGGLGVAYTREQRPPPAGEYVRAVADAAHAAFGDELRLLIEPGRAIVANAAVTLYTVQTVKRNVSAWVAVDGGMSDNLRPMLYDARYEVIHASRPLAEPTGRFHLAGKHCESGDVLVWDAPLADPSPGDVLVIPATGAYGYAMANNYNGVLRPPVVFCRDGAARLVVRRERYEDLRARDLDYAAAPAGEAEGR
jgi:diaminopimelate decarboxylase